MKHDDDRLRTARAVLAFQDHVSEDVQLKVAMNHLELIERNRQFAKDRHRPKRNPLADMLGTLADTARARSGKLWPSVRDAMIESVENITPLVGGFGVKAIEGRGFADSYAKADLAGIYITFEMPDGTEKTLSGHTVYKYVMARRLTT